MVRDARRLGRRAGGTNMNHCIVFRCAWLVGGLGSTVVGGWRAAGPGRSEAPSSVAQRIVDGDTRVVTFSQNMPERAVGFITADGAMLCTGTPIQRDVILTAGHCFCRFPSVFPSTFVFHLFNAAGVDVGPTASGIAASGYFFDRIPSICTNARDAQSEPDSRVD